MSKYGIQDTEISYIMTCNYGIYDKIACFSSHETPGSCVKRYFDGNDL